MRARALSIVTLLVLALLAPAASHGYLINKDVRQAFATPQDNFEICFRGNFLNVPVNRGIIAPPGWNNVQKSYNPATNETCFSFSGPPLKQQPRGQQYHFGIGLGTTIQRQTETREYWTQSTKPSSTPGGSCGFSYNATTGTVSAVLSNDTAVSQTYSRVGFQVLASEPALGALNRVNMPPSSFRPSGIPDGTVLGPGQSRTFTVPQVAPSASFVCNFTVNGAGTPYGDDVIIWTDEVVTPR
jgi:hypothetical protein